MIPPVHRRTLLRGALASPALLLGRAHARRDALLAPTAAQIEGPFYPVELPKESDLDLTRIGRGARARGEVIEVRGRVLGPEGWALPGATVELWQANAAGRYHHPADRETSGPLDPGFQGFGRVQADREGRFRFVTVVPGTYLAARDWRRPPHLHFKVRPAFGPTLTTQVYFAGDPLNATDAILQRLSPAQQAAVTLAFKPGDSGARLGRVDFILPKA